MSRRHANIWSHPGHYLVDPYTWPWSPNGEDQIWPWKFKCQGHGQGQTHWSHLRPGVQTICLLFVSWQSDHFCLRYSKFHILPWKFKVKVMVKLFWLLFSEVPWHSPVSFSQWVLKWLYYTVFPLTHNRCEVVISWWSPLLPKISIYATKCESILEKSGIFIHLQSKYCINLSCKRI